MYDRNFPEFEVVYPCYNESQSLPLLLEKAVAAAKKFGLSQEQVKIVLVNNGSTDSSSAVFDELSRGAFKEWLKLVTVVRNQGYGFGVWTGLQATSAQVVGWSHADLQCNPEDVFFAYQKLRESKTPQKTLVKGVRAGRNWKDQIVSRVFEIVAMIVLNLKVFEMNAQPKIFSRMLLEQIKSPPWTFAFDLYVLYIAKKNRYSIESIPVAFPQRLFGVSKWASTFFSRYKTILGMIRYMFHLQRQEGRLRF